MQASTRHASGPAQTSVDLCCAIAIIARLSILAQTILWPYDGLQAGPESAKKYK